METTIPIPTTLPVRTADLLKCVRENCTLPTSLASLITQYYGVEPTMLQCEYCEQFGTLVTSQSLFGEDDEFRIDVIPFPPKEGEGVKKRTPMSYFNNKDGTRGAESIEIERLLTRDESHFEFNCNKCWRTYIACKHCSILEPGKSSNRSLLHISLTRFLGSEAECGYALKQNELDKITTDRNFWLAHAQKYQRTAFGINTNDFSNKFVLGCGAGLPRNDPDDVELVSILGEDGEDGHWWHCDKCQKTERFRLG